MQDGYEFDIQAGRAYDENWANGNYYEELKEGKLLRALMSLSAVTGIATGFTASVGSITPAEIAEGISKSRPPSTFILSLVFPRIWDTYFTVRERLESI